MHEIISYDGVISASSRLYQGELNWSFQNRCLLLLLALVAKGLWYRLLISCLGQVLVCCGILAKEKAYWSWYQLFLHKGFYMENLTLVDQDPVEIRLKIVQPTEKHKQFPQHSHPFRDVASNISSCLVSEIVDAFWAAFLQSKERKRLPVFWVN